MNPMGLQERGHRDPSDISNVQLGQNVPGLYSDTKRSEGQGTEEHEDRGTRPPAVVSDHAFGDGHLGEGSQHAVRSGGECRRLGCFLFINIHQI